MTVTTPIDPGNTGALAKIAYDQLTHYGNVPFEQRISGSVEKYRKIADAVARAVCPTGHHVIADDDLRALLEALRVITFYEGLMPDAYDRLRAAIGDEG